MSPTTPGKRGERVRRPFQQSQRALLGVIIALVAWFTGAAANAEEKPAIVVADFELKNGYGEWVVEGDAFGSQPARATAFNIQGHRGLQIANSLARGDAATGTITSPPFDIRHSHISFLIGGGRHPGDTGLELLVEEKSMRSATGNNSGDLQWQSWDVSELAGKTAVIRIFDRATGDWGHINVDHILLTNSPQAGAGTWRLDQYRRSAEYYQEPFRPGYHFTPELNWMNDPNGLVFFDGEYHLFYQHNPHGNSWGNMSWGHAVSRDLLHWKHLPIALHDEYGIMAFSGSAVVDWNNTSGFGENGKPPLIAIYTGHGHGLQTQDIAYSNDRGRTWMKYEGNPVLDIREAEFRDPKVFWHEPSTQWIMVVSLALQKRLQFYGSPDLKQWTLLGEFGPSGTKNKPNWECPDLFQLPVTNLPGESRWLLEADMGSGAVAGGSGGEYFIGAFDGKHFVAETAEAKWVDYGRDFYAPVSWSDIPGEDGRRIWIGWMNNWETALVPTYPWRSAMSIPREITLREIHGQIRMCQSPVRELQSLRGEPTSLKHVKLNNNSHEIPLRGQQLEIIADIEVGTATEVGFQVLKGGDQQTTIAYDVQSRKLFVDRTQSGIVDFHPAFSGRHGGPLAANRRQIRIHILVDRSSVEVFGNDGETVITELVFPDASSDGVVIYARGGTAELVSGDLWPLASVWKR